MESTLNEAAVVLWHTICNRINEDDPENYVSLQDVDYWAEQIHNLTNEEDYNHARAVAEAIAQTLTEVTES